MRALFAVVLLLVALPGLARTNPDDNMAALKKLKAQGMATVDAAVEATPQIAAAGQQRYPRRLA